MASNKHHELTKLVMNQVSDLLADYSIRQANKFVNINGFYPRLIKFDYLGKYSLKGKTHLLIEVGLELTADYAYFNTGHTWINTKQKYYISNFGCYRTNLVPNTPEDGFFSKTYELVTDTDGQVEVELIRHELACYFLPYLEKMTNLDSLITYLHWHKPNMEEMTHAYRNHSFFYNWLTVIYLLLTEARVLEAELCIEKISHIAYSLDQLNPNYRVSEGLFVTIDKLQKDFTLKYSYRYDERTRLININ